MRADLIQIQELLNEPEPKIQMALRIIEDILGQPESTPSVYYDVRWLRHTLVEKQIALDVVEARTIEEIISNTAKLENYILHGAPNADS